jgi:hypothetical protein
LSRTRCIIGMGSFFADSWEAVSIDMVKSPHII